MFNGYGFSLLQDKKTVLDMSWVGPKKTKKINIIINNNKASFMNG